MHRKIVSGTLAALLAVGTVVLPLENFVKLPGNAMENVLAESKSPVKLDSSVIQYPGRYFKSRQIPCEALGGIYFLNKNELVFYSVDTGVSSLVYTFEDYAEVYSTSSKLYVLGYSRYIDSGYCSEVTVFDLNLQKVEKTITFPKKISTVGADALGRVYLAGPDDEGYGIYLLSAEGELLSQTTSKQQIFGFCGFDPTNGNFYVDSYDNWVYWGYDHAMHALRAGNVTENEISFSETGLQFIAQAYAYERQKQVELLGDKYLCVDSTFEPGLYVWDSNAYSVKEENDTQVMALKRDNKESGKFDSRDCVGARAVYRKDSDTMIAFKNNSTIAEYNISTGEEIVSAATAYPVFSLLEYKNGIAAIERNGNDFYFEYFPWTKATTVKITGSASEMKAGESLKLSTATDGTLEENFTWTSSDSKIASVNQSGEVFAWHMGMVTIGVKSKSGLSAEYTINVSTASSVQNPANHTVTTSGTKTGNASANNYTVWSSPMNSYLIENADSTLTRIEYNDKKVIVENYSLDGSALQSSKTLDTELQLFGGFYSGSDYNYVVFGNENSSESDTCEVMRIVKYSKDWNRISSVSVNGANTYIPFDAGSLRMTEADGKLYIHTCHEMYASDDGLHHQANMTFVVKESDLTIEQSYYDVMNIAQAGYVSHSFNQFVRTDGRSVYRVDHGDAGPRAVSITRCKIDGSIEDVDYILPIDLLNVDGYNKTGASVGGFELSSENCIIAGNAVDFTVPNANCNGIRNIFVSITDTELEDSNIVWLTKYGNNDKVEARTPHLVKIGKDSFLVMWEEMDEEGDICTELLTIDGSGTITSNQVSANMRLSDCEPILCKDGLVRWYAAEDGSPVLYAVNPFDLEAAHTHIFDKGTITKEPTCTEKGIKTYRCKKCSATKEEEVSEKGHSYDKGTITKQPTVILEGEKTYTCKNCGETKTERIEKISPTSISKATIGGFSDKVYTGGEMKPALTVKLNGKLLKENTDYQIFYENNISVGKATVRIEGIGNYTGTITGEFYIKPKATAITTVKSPKKAQMKVTWKKDPQADGYQIVYATNSKFTKGKKAIIVDVSKTSKTITKLSKGKKYYVRIHAYKTIDGKKVYGTYSKIMTVTIKKK